MRKNFLKSLVVFFAFSILMQITSFVSNANDAKNVNVEDMPFEVIVNDVNDNANYDVDNDIKSSLEDLISGYVGHYELDIDFVISQVKELIKDKNVDDKILNMFSSYELDIYEDGRAKIVMTCNIEPCEVKSTINMEFGDVTDDSIILKMKNGNDFIDFILKKKEIEGKQYLVSECMGTVSYFEKVI